MFAVDVFGRCRCVTNGPGRPAGVDQAAVVTVLPLMPILAQVVLSTRVVSSNRVLRIR